MACSCLSLRISLLFLLFFFFFNDTATTEIYTLSLHDALPICRPAPRGARAGPRQPLPVRRATQPGSASRPVRHRGCNRCGSEEHTSELQSRLHLVCRLLLEKKKKTKQIRPAVQLLTKSDTY